MRTRLNRAYPSLAIFARNLRDDRKGAVAIQMALISVALLGMTGLATDVGYAYYIHRQMQSAADTAAFSAAQAILAGFPPSDSTEAYAVAGQVGFVNGVNGVSITVNQPPVSPPATATDAANASAIQVIVQQSSVTLPLISAVCPLLPGGGCSGTFTMGAQAVVASVGGGGCVLQVYRGANPGVTLTGGGSMTLNGCGLAVNSAGSTAFSMTGGTTITLNNSAGTARDPTQKINVVGGTYYHNGAVINGVTAPAAFPDVKTNQAQAPDPYATVSMPSPTGVTACATSGKTGLSSKTSKGITTVTYGSTYSGTISPCSWANENVVISNSANLTLSAGTYFMNAGSGGGNFDLQGNATVTGNKVTLVLTGSGSNWATTTIEAGGKLNLTAPPAGAAVGIPGIAIFGDRNAPETTSSSFIGGSTMNITGAIYLPTQSVTFANGAANPTGCLQLIVGTLAVSGGVTLSNHCSGIGTSPINTGGSGYALVE